MSLVGYFAQKVPHRFSVMVLLSVKRMTMNLGDHNLEVATKEEGQIVIWEELCVTIAISQDT